MVFVDLIPRTKHIASTIFDFPEPFAPQITLKPEGNGSEVLFANDLKPCIESLSILTMVITIYIENLK